VLDLQTALNYQRALATFTRIVDEPASVPGLLQNAAAQVARITHIEHVKIRCYRPDRGDLLVEAGVGWKPGVVGHASFSADRFFRARPLDANRSPGRGRGHRERSRMADVLRDQPCLPGRMGARGEGPCDIAPSVRAELVSPRLIP
jgi:hypothetical protein